MTAPSSSVAFSWPVRIYYEDTDASGVAYHARYLAWFERCRSEWLRARGMSHQRLEAEHQAAFTLNRIEIEYRRPARLDDLLTATLRIAERGRASVTFEQTLVDGAGQLYARAMVTVLCVDRQRFKPRPWPAGWLDGG